jgi:hypothetical protein
MGRKSLIVNSLKLGPGRFFFNDQHYRTPTAQIFPLAPGGGSAKGGGLPLTMPNTFYTPFDFETLEPQHQRASEYRTIFQINRDRIIHTSAFRRLQSKSHATHA